MGTMLHNIGLHIFSTTFDKLPSTAAATGVENRQSTAELENSEFPNAPSQKVPAFSSKAQALKEQPIRTIALCSDVAAIDGRHLQNGHDVVLIQSHFLCQSQALRQPSQDCANQHVGNQLHLGGTAYLTCKVKVKFWQGQ